MNLQQLEYFKAISETKSFTTASKLLSVTQPALSKSIANLEEELTYLPVRKEEYVLIVPKNHPLANQMEVSLQDLQDEPFILYGENKEALLEHYNKVLGYPPNIKMHTSEVSMVEGLVAAGVGIAIVSNTPLLNNALFSIVKIHEKFCYRTIYMGWNQESPLPPLAKEFLHFMEQAANHNL